MRKNLLAAALFCCGSFFAQAQTPKGITLEEYNKAKTFRIADLDNDTYVKFENTYVLDRYEEKKPYFVTGDDGKRKRIDLYTLSKKADGATLGTMIFYTNEKGTTYNACLPNNFADGKVWEQYFTDIHTIDKTEPNFVLKLSYVLSREFSFQAYKATLKGKEVDRSEAGTYGNDICFPGTEMVLMADGSKKQLSAIVPGDAVMTVDPKTKQPAVVKVNKLVAHEAQNYAVTHLTLIRAAESNKRNAHEVVLSIHEVEATPNHPILTKDGVKSFGTVAEGEAVTCQNKEGRFESFTVWHKQEGAKGMQQVYNIDASGGDTFIINGVMVLQKQPATK